MTRGAEVSRGQQVCGPRGTLVVRGQGTVVCHDRAAVWELLERVAGLAVGAEAFGRDAV